MIKALLALNYVVVTGLVYVTFARYPDHSPEAVVSWVVFYVFGIVQPALWTWMVLKEYRRLQVPVSDRLRRLAYGPVVTGVVMALLSLTLLFRR